MRTRLGHSVAFQRARQAEIHHQDSARAVLHDVLRLEVPVNHSHAVRRIQSLAYLLNDLHRFLWSKFLLLADEGSQILTLDELHRDELHARGFTEVVNADHVAVRDLVSEQQLLLKTGQDCRVRSQFRPDDFQRDEPSQVRGHWPYTLRPYRPRRAVAGFRIAHPIRRQSVIRLRWHTRRNLGDGVRSPAKRSSRRNRSVGVY